MEILKWVSCCKTLTNGWVRQEFSRLSLTAVSSLGGGTTWLARRMRCGEQSSAPSGRVLAEGKLHRPAKLIDLME